MLFNRLFNMMFNRRDFLFTLKNAGLDLQIDHIWQVKLIQDPKIKTPAEPCLTTVFNVAILERPQICTKYLFKNQNGPLMKLHVSDQA